MSDPTSSTLRIGAHVDQTDPVAEAQARVHAYISQFKEGYFPPLVNLARLTEEVGELAREINHRFGPKTKKADEPDADIALELADILFVIIAIGESLIVAGTAVANDERSAALAAAAAGAAGRPIRPHDGPRAPQARAPAPGRGAARPRRGPTPGVR